MENNLSKVYTEVLLILSYMEQTYVDMIPKKLLELFNEKKDKNYQPNINPNVSLKEQNLQRKTLALLAMLNLNYWCKDENEKKEIEMRKIYNVDNLFKKQNNIKQRDNIRQDATELIVYKEQNIFKKILKKIMKFLKNDD